MKSLILIIFLSVIFIASCSNSDDFNLPENVAIPKGMVLVPGGKIILGSEQGLDNEKNGYTVNLKPFFIDVNPVTVAEFRKFVAATKYKTQAEIFGDAAVLNDTTKVWELRKGVNWEFPQGEKFGKAKDNHPVTQVSWNDAQAYCKWAKKRLPTEAEWEHAAKNGEDIKTLFPWGNEQKVNGKYKANFWQGNFPYVNEVEDKFAFTNPVGAFGKTPLGLTDMAGNVWEWCEDWYLPYNKYDEPFQPNENSEKVQRGGSFLCDPKVCYGFRTTARSHSTPESALYHVGFRTVKDIE
ncbi:MAG: formylglycine-generating enzyme family protein [Saprospiraceae bacterium]